MSRSRCIFAKENYKVIKFDKTSYLVLNSNKEFENGHTHVFSYHIAKAVVLSCVNGQIPPRDSRLKGNKRFLVSILRVCSNNHKKYFEDLYNKLT